MLVNDSALTSVYKLMIEIGKYLRNRNRWTSHARPPWPNQW